MLCQLPTDCLNEIFEHLEEDTITLHSCLLVSRLWCKISVKILWRNIWNFDYSYQHRLRVETAILSTLIACLPNDSIALLYRNKIFISTPTFKQPLFNYAAFCKVLPIYRINLMIDDVLKNESTSVTSISLPSLKDRYCLLSKEIITMFMNQIFSLKKLIYTYYYSYTLKDTIPFICFPEKKDCLIDLSELYCSSNINSEFFHQLSQVCHNLQSLSINFGDEVSPNELNELISSQNNLKNLNLFAYCDSNWTSVIPALKKHSDTLRKLHIYCDNYDCDSLPLSFIASFSNLQEIKISFFEKINFEGFKKLQNATFPKLEILKFPYAYPKIDNMVKFLENNGKYLREFHIIDGYSESLGLFIAKFCPNLKKLSLGFNNDELNTLKTIFNNCQYLESIKVWCGGRYHLSEKVVLETVVKHSPENFCELKITNDSLSELFSDLELFFINWKNRASQKLLTLIILNEDDDLTDENIEIIEKYKNLGIIKKFDIKEFGYEESEENEDEFI